MSTTLLIILCGLFVFGLSNVISDENVKYNAEKDQDNRNMRGYRQQDLRNSRMLLLEYIKTKERYGEKYAREYLKDDLIHYEKWLNIWLKDNTL